MLRLVRVFVLLALASLFGFSFALLVSWPIHPLNTSLLIVGFSVAAGLATQATLSLFTFAARRLKRSPCK